MIKFSLVYVPRKTSGRKSTFLLAIRKHFSKKFKKFFFCCEKYLDEWMNFLHIPFQH